MKLIHLSDLHLGKRIHQFSMIEDQKYILEKIVEIVKEEKVDGILAYASDPAALPAAIVSERLGLPTNPAKSVEILGLKHPWRQFLQKHKFACPKNYSFHPQSPIEELKENTKHFTFPFGNSLIASFIESDIVSAYIITRPSAFLAALPIV